MHPHKLKIVFISLLLFAISSHSQNYQLSHFSLNDGLPQSQVNDVVQDNLGYLWVATDGGGIARFDGNKFIIFDVSDGLISNYAAHLNFIDSRLFIGTNKGLSIKVNDEIFSYKSVAVNSISNIKNQIYLGTSKGVRIFSDLEIIPIFLDSILDASTINDIYFDGNTSWISSNNGLWKVDDINSAAQSVKQISSFNSVGIIATQKGLLYATKNNGFFKIESKTIALEKLGNTKNCNAISLSKDETKLFITNGNVGISEFNFETNSLYINLPALSKLNINSLFIDQQSNKWIAASDGLYKLSTSSFKNYLNTQTITAILPENDAVFTATADGNLFYIDSLGANKIPDFHQNIYALNSNRQGQLFAGTDDGILVLDSLKVVDTIAFVKDVQKIILKDSVFWVSSTTHGISKFKYDFESKEINDTIRFNKKDGLYDLSINDIQLDSLNRLWYISSKGFLGFIKDNVVNHLGRKLPNNATIGSIVIHNSSIYLGTRGEGIWWSKLSEKPRFKLLRGKKKLPNKNIYQLEFDTQNNLWAGLQKGAAQIKLTKNNSIVDIVYFDKYNGFIGAETMQNVISPVNLGAVYFGTIEGLTKYEPAGNSVDTIKLTIHFETIEVAYKVLDSIDEKDFKFSPTENHLSFSFKTIAINHPNEIVYRWRMNEDEWSEWSDNTAVVFANLEAGAYRFEAQSKTANQLLSEPIEFQFFIEIALVKTLWFRLSIISVAFLIIFLFVWNYFKIQKRKSKNKETQLALENDLLSLEQKALRLQMNPHFIFNVLNGIKALGATNVEKMNTVIQKFAGLMRATLHNSRQENITLKEEMATLQFYLELEQLMGAKEFKFDIYVDDKIDAEEVMLAPMIIQPFVENAIEHGVLNIDYLGKISISFAIKDNCLSCQIEDNGIGYEQSLKNKKQSPHQSVALDVTKERIHMISKKSAFKIEELKDSKGEILGTLVSFNLPLITDY